MLRYDLLAATPVIAEPFEYFMIPQFIRAEHLDAIQRDFPAIKEGGSFPLASLQFGPAFRQLTDELVGEPLRAALAKKFDMDLSDRPATLTVRGRTRMKDGQIHTDSVTKLITVLVYLNRDWSNTGGRLRLLRSATNLEDVIAEVPPTEGSMVAFRCRPNAWHGHHPHDGPRRSMQLNYVTSASASRWSSIRHGVSAMLKSFRG
ncbi:MAG: 2OG-Fe(II) oxygenase [Pirellulaceae bacterium]|nr:2OG-Fe(II) oxygenase [Pirellulaceae bacterium]